MSLRLFACSFVDPVDGQAVALTVAGDSAEGVQALVGRLHAGVSVDGEVMARGDITPDGPRTTWVADGVDRDRVERGAMDAFGG